MDCQNGNSSHLVDGFSIFFQLPKFKLYTHNTPIQIHFLSTHKILLSHFSPSYNSEMHLYTQLVAILNHSPSIVTNQVGMSILITGLAALIEIRCSKFLTKSTSVCSNIVPHFVASNSQGLKKLVIKCARAATELPPHMPKVASNVILMDEQVASTSLADSIFGKHGYFKIG